MYIIEACIKKIGSIDGWAKTLVTNRLVGSGAAVVTVVTAIAMTVKPHDGFFFR